MQYRSFFSFLTVVVLTIAGSIAVAGQTGPVSGRVELEAGGKRTPVAGATIDIYRTDIKGGFPGTKTNKKGEFAIAGLMLGGEYTFSVSAPNINPIVYPKIRAGQEGIVITVYPGDGRKLTEAEARKGSLAATDTNAPPQLTAEEEKARAEHEAKVKEIEAKNQKIEKTNEVITRANKEGNEALAAKNYDLAIAKFQEGIDADPDFVGSAPVFYINRGIAQKQRAVENYNKLAKLESTERAAGMAAVKKDMLDSAEAELKAWTMLKNSTADASAKSRIDGAIKAGRDALHAASQMTQVDPKIVEVAKVLLPEYQAIETDAVKKTEAGLILAHLYRILEERENAIAEYKKVLEASPDNPDALAYAGLVLVDLSWLKDNDKALSQEGANYLQKFVSVAPDTHRLKEGAAEYLAILKTQNVVPVKATPTRKRN